MATTPTPATALDGVVVLQPGNGIALIPKPTPLTGLNYFDGKCLRAADMTAEQEYHRRLQQLATQAGGPGVVHGFGLRLLAGDQVELAAPRPAAVAALAQAWPGSTRPMKMRPS